PARYQDIAALRPHPATAWRSAANVLSGETCGNRRICPSSGEPFRLPAAAPKGPLMSVTDASLQPAADLFTASLQQSDPEIAEVVRGELGPSCDAIALRASEIICSAAGIEA